ncbi:MAG: hypothetical protein ACLTXI_07220 [Collinsella sp.]
MPVPSGEGVIEACVDARFVAKVPAEVSEGLRYLLIILGTRIW